MKIAVIGGGPAGLYFSYLMKRDDSAHDITVIEQNPRDATFGFGVVFSERALEFLRADDEDTYQCLMPHMEAWPDLKIVHKDEHMAIDGNGFTAIGRLELLQLLQARCESVGVVLKFDSVVHSRDELEDADLIVAADGVNSFIRRAYADQFQASETQLQNPFVWYGTTQLFDCLSLTFRENDHGVFCAHHYRYSPTMSTFLVETDPATFANAGFAQMDDAQSRAYCEAVFVRDLDGHKLVSNKSDWRWFPQIWNERWSTGNIVLLGDALHTAHFSIGSGTRLAMEDAIALFKAMGGFATNGVNMTKLESYQIEGTFTATMFYADIEGHPSERNVRLALEELSFFSSELTILGTYHASPYREELEKRNQPPAE